MASGYLEHVNLTVSDPDRTSAFLQKLCGWHERWRGPAQNGGWTIHVGGERDYLAVYSPGELIDLPFAKGAPLNHIGIVVDDLARAEQVVIEAGLTPTNFFDYEPGRRFYFFDWDGIEFELVNYDEAPARG